METQTEGRYRNMVSSAPPNFASLIAAVELFRQIDPEMPSPAIAAFLQIADNPGITIMELAERLKIAQSSSSRNVFYLSKQSKSKKTSHKGHDLVVSHINETDRRQRNLFLSPRGKRVAENLRRIIT